MANQKTSTTEAVVKELVVKARFIMREFEQKDDNGNKTTREYLSFELIEPFGPEELLKDVALKAKWDKYDEKNRLVRPDRVFSNMSYYARKALRKAPEVPVTVKIRPVTYQSSKTKEMVSYAGIFADPTFTELEDEKPVEMVVKGAQVAMDFALLAGNALGIKYKPKHDDDPYGLMDN